jgi:hypothetical protein
VACCARLHLQLARPRSSPLTTTHAAPLRGKSHTQGAQDKRLGLAADADTGYVRVWTSG